MTSIMLTVTGAKARASVSGPLTSGMVGIPVTIEYDDAWNGLTKNLVCRCGKWGPERGETRTILNVGETATVAQEVMQANMYLYLAVEGYSDDGTLVMPTTWAECGKIQHGASAGADPSADPKLYVWNQLQTEIKQIKKNAVTQEQLADIQVAVQTAEAAALRAETAAKNAEAGSNASQNTNFAGTADINIRKWFRKKIIVDGSSITKGETGNTLPTWSSFLKDMFALDAVYNHAVSGTGWFFGGNSHVVDRVDAYEADADAIILMGDYNGIYAYTSNAGTIADKAAADGSYYAKLKYLAEKLIAKYPLCPVIWVVEPPRASVGETGGEKTPMNYNSIYAVQSKAIEEVADCYGFTHCNLMKNTVFRPWIQENYDATTSDGTHPWNNIQRTMAQVIAETMKRTPLIYNESYVVIPDDSSGGDTGGESDGVTLTSITATFTQGDVVIKTTDELDVLRNYLRVVATYSDLSEAAVTDYTLSGTLTEGISTITVTYMEKTATFAVTVTHDDGSVTINANTLSPTLGYLNGTGIETSTTQYYTKDYLPVIGGTDITFAVVGNGPKSWYVYYDSNKAYLGHVKGVYGTYTYTLPDDAAYIRFNIGTDPDAQTITYFPRDDSGDENGGNTGSETEVTLTGISAAFTQGNAVIKTTDELDVLRDYLRVVAIYSDLSEVPVTDYTLSGELTEGTSTITVTYGTVTATFDVKVALDDGSVTVALGDVIDESLIGYYFANKGTGWTSTRDGMRISRYLPVADGTMITLSANLAYPNLTDADICYYDAGKTYLSKADHIYGTREFIVPDGASYFRICFDDDDDTVAITYVTA